ncbi:MAG TPA: glycosyltransferase family 87 protein [Solirubrobacterales bacterium]|nr:glycosyltransferase family 87 protein [Solirubrobacterales bacterium]
MALSPKLKVPVWIGAWILTRALIVVQVGFWHPGGAEYNDVLSYESWSNYIAHEHALPTEETWQYPPGTALLLLIPRLGGGHFGVSFVVLMLLVDLAGLWLVTRLAKEGGRDTGVWVWLLGMPVLATLPVLRFDLVPAVLAVAALLVIHRRPAWFGALAGLGATVKLWPVLVLFGEWERPRLIRSAAAAAAVIVAVAALTAVAFDHPFGFVTNQNDRGLQIESVAATPWELNAVVTGEEPAIAQRFGTSEIDTGLGDAVGKFLDFVALATLAAAAVWWWLRDRAIREGRQDLADLDLSRDFAFTVILLFVVTSRVLSPQFMVWLVALCAVVLSARRTRLARDAWIVLAAVALTAAFPVSPGYLVLRNVALLFAAVDASVSLVLAVREPAAGATRAAS